MNTHTPNNIIDDPAGSQSGEAKVLAAMGHELRSPLNAVIGLSDLLGRRTFGPLMEKQAEFVHHINRSGRHLLSLIDELLATAASCDEGGSVHLHPRRGAVEPGASAASPAQQDWRGQSVPAEEGER